MVSRWCCLLFLLQIAQGGAQLQFQPLAGYMPETEVVDASRIDLDQQAMETQLTLGTADSFRAARAMYEEGAHSGPYAILTLHSRLPNALKKGHVITGKSRDGTPLTGRLLKAAEKNEKIIEFAYSPLSLESNKKKCKVGALVRLREAELDGCLSNVENAVVDILGLGTFIYTYNIRRDNRNFRTLQGFSREAAQNMLNCQSCPTRVFAKFNKYYGTPEYGDQFVEAAFTGGKTTSFKNGVVDFDKFDDQSRAEAISIGSVLLNLWMSITNEMEQAVQACLRQDVNTAQPWDTAVALYTGSLEGEDGSGEGELIHALADQHCQLFRTCGTKGDRVTGRASITFQIFKLFELGLELINENECVALRDTKEQIENKMVVPLIQGVLETTYLLDRLEEEKLRHARALSFAATVLPIVSACNRRDAQVIYDNIKVSGDIVPRPDFLAIKRAFELNYRCMGITCQDVGGFWDEADTSYYTDADPCLVEPTRRSNKVGVAVGSTLAVVAVILIAAIFVMRRRRNGVETKMLPKASTFTEGSNDGQEQAQVQEKSGEPQLAQNEEGELA